MKYLSCVQLFGTPWTVAHQAPQPVGFSSQEYWSGLPFPSPGALPDPGIELGSPSLQADVLPAGKASAYNPGAGGLIPRLGSRIEDPGGLQSMGYIQMIPPPPPNENYLPYLGRKRAAMLEHFSTSELSYSQQVNTNKR